MHFICLFVSTFAACYYYDYNCQHHCPANCSCNHSQTATAGFLNFNLVSCDGQKGEVDIKELELVYVKGLGGIGNC